ncbi:hypothetical protein GSH05_33570 [Burkholderia pseudomallei]|nr:hypothetical protein CXQ84_13355 [Burkholderia pseudomallei]AYX27726.1 hypothetical protein EGY16_05840 [Burkholderia pseudomallei]MBM5656357.1 hypothetical protein [Burkholderia pseudomallei]MBM5664136.1 hypothetical protein [Burkholderia pseudomallei]MPT60972.1 hypothetical protein [Burkholderia pseudomallei]
MRFGERPLRRRTLASALQASSRNRMRAVGWIGAYGFERRQRRCRGPAASLISQCTSRCWHRWRAPARRL